MIVTPAGSFWWIGESYTTILQLKDGKENGTINSAISQSDIMNTVFTANLLPSVCWGVMQGWGCNILVHRLKLGYSIHPIWTVKGLPAVLFYTHVRTYTHTHMHNSALSNSRNRHTEALATWISDTSLKLIQLWPPTSQSKLVLWQLFSFAYYSLMLGMCYNAHSSTY